MSFVRNLSVFRGTLGVLGVQGGQSLGRGGPEVQLQDSFPCHPFSLSQVPIPLLSHSPSSIRGIALSNAVADLQENNNNNWIFICSECLFFQTF